MRQWQGWTHANIIDLVNADPLHFDVGVVGDEEEPLIRAKSG